MTRHISIESGYNHLYEEWVNSQLYKIIFWGNTLPIFTCQINDRSSHLKINIVLYNKVSNCACYFRTPGGGKFKTVVYRKLNPVNRFVTLKGCHICISNSTIKIFTLRIFQAVFFPRSQTFAARAVSRLITTKTFTSTEILIRTPSVVKLRFNY